MSVHDTETRREIFHMPCPEAVYSIYLTTESVCYADGQRATMLGRGGTQYAWHEQPSFELLTHFVQEC